MTQDVPHGSSQGDSFLPGDCVAASRGVQAGTKERFARVYVPDPRDPALIQKECFQIPPRMQQLGPEPAGVESRAQRVFSQALHLVQREQRGCLLNVQKAEASWIAILQFSATLELNDGVSVLGFCCRLRKIEKPPRHSEMNQPECLRLHFEDQVFSHAMDTPDSPVRERRGEVAGDRRAQ